MLNVNYKNKKREISFFSFIQLLTNINLKIITMKVEIFEVAYSELGLSNNCVTFNSTSKTQQILATHSYSITGICIITLNTGKVNTYKFAFSCIGDDGTIDTVSEQFILDKGVVKSCIVDYAVKLITGKGK